MTDLLPPPRRLTPTLAVAIAVYVASATRGDRARLYVALCDLCSLKEDDAAARAESGASIRAVAARYGVAQRTLAVAMENVIRVLREADGLAAGCLWRLVASELNEIKEDTEGDADG